MIDRQAGIVDNAHMVCAVWSMLLSAIRLFVCPGIIIIINEY